MFRNNYDNDSVTFSPQGRIFQVEYAQEAVKQGSVVVGIVSKTHAVLAAIKVRWRTWRRHLAKTVESWGMIDFNGYFRICS